MTSLSRPTQRDVARAAGVSQAIVSYVVNGVQTVSILPETRARVEAAVQELGYVPNRAARSLRSSRTNTIAAIIPDITNPYYPEFIRGIQDTARDRNYDVLASNTDGDPEIEHAALQAARRSHVDGVIVSAFSLGLDDFLPMLRGGTPVTLLGPAPTDPVPSLAFDSVSVSGEDAAFAVVSYLLDRGHTRIGMISGQVNSPPREARVLGYRQALAERNLPHEEILIRGGDFSETGGYDAMRELLAIAPRPTAVFAANDLMAMGALLACRDQAVRVPDDIALAGFDDIPAARLVHPSLTTLNQHAHATGCQAAELLLSRLDGSYTGPTRHERLGFDLVPRESA